MIKQKHGFWLFCFSLIPGAGEMYMGFKKQGISLMLLFMSVFALGAATGMDWVIVFFPVIWFYSFFNVHNLKSLSPDEFYSLEDSYVLHLDQVFGNADSFLNKYRTLIGILLIVFGFSILWNNFADILYYILPGFMANAISAISYRLPQIIIAIAILFAGFYLLSNKKKQLRETQDTGNSEHFWEPYRPYQQSASAPVVQPAEHPVASNVPEAVSSPVSPAPAVPTPASVPAPSSTSSVEKDTETIATDEPA